MELRWNSGDLPELIAERAREIGLSKLSGVAPTLAYGRHRGPAPHNARRAAVLLLVYPIQGVWHLALTRRQATLSVHAGQISLPGGAAEKREPAEVTALRETEEELGVPRKDVRLLTPLPEIYLFNSNFRVIPWLGMTRRRPDFQPNPAEVAELIELPLSAVHNRDVHRTMKIRRGRLSFTAPVIEFEGHQIWGATRLILADLAVRIPPAALNSRS